MLKNPSHKIAKKALFCNSSILFYSVNKRISLEPNKVEATCKMSIDKTEYFLTKYVLSVEPRF